MPWWRDRILWIALILGLVVRVLPLMLWVDIPCTHDECGYIKLASRMADGEGMGRWSHGWVWAPGYVGFLALHQLLFGYASFGVGTQAVLVSASPILAYQLARKHLDLRAARIAAWLFTLSPTLQFFGHHWWGEAFYTLWILGALWGIDRARDGRLRDAVVPGVFIALCVYFRGVGQYLLPVLAIGMAIGRPPRFLSKIGVMALTAVLLVAPYSVYASKKFGGPMLTDMTFGANMWLGNNDFPPQTFDWGLNKSDEELKAYTDANGRPHCDRKGITAYEWDQCERDNGWAWIEANPGEFVRRIPLRMAQLFNPNSFLTRHVRKGLYPGLPPVLGEAMVLTTIGFSLLAVWGGTVGAFGRGRSWLLPTTLLVVLYHCGAHAVFVGLSRYRVPLDALWLIWAAGLLSDPRATLSGLVGWRRAAAVGLLVIAIPLCLWFLPLAYS